VKPFDRKEVLARVDAHLKRAQDSKDGVVKTDNFEINQNSFQFSFKGNTVELTKIEFRMMYVLMQNNGTVVENEDLISAVWGEDDSMVDPPIRIHIANLRKKINDTDFKIIRTIPAVGYIFNDPLE
jgi:DNA-binding response OmpR family regulator